MKTTSIQQRQFQIFTRLSYAIVLGLTCLVTGCQKDKKAAAPPSSPPAVAVVRVTPTDVPVVFKYVAQTQSSQLVNIQARVNGYLDKRVYTEGSVVQAGDVLFQLDAKPFKAALDQAEALLAQQKAAYETARLNYERTKALAQQKVATPKDLDDATGRFLSAGAAVQQASAEVETAKLNLSYTTITSPVTGVSGSAHQTEGTYINQTNNQLTEVTVLSPMWVNFSLTESELLRYRDQVAKGLLRPPKDGSYEVEVVLVDGSTFPHTGSITFAEPSFNSQTGTFLLRASVDNPDGNLRPNQNVHVLLKGGVRPNSILVPQRAVQEGSKGQFVWVVNKDNKVEQRPVTVGTWHEDQWFIQEGLTMDEQVVADGVLGLQAGEEVLPQPNKSRDIAPENGELSTSPTATDGK